MALLRAISTRASLYSSPQAFSRRLALGTPCGHVGVPTTWHSGSTNSPCSFSIWAKRNRCSSNGQPHGKAEHESATAHSIIPPSFSTNGRRFIAPTRYDEPSGLYYLSTLPNKSGLTARYLRKDNPHECLMYTGGSCLQNGREGARGGYAVNYGFCGESDMLRGRSKNRKSKLAANPQHVDGVLYSPLEERGPGGTKEPQTNVRAWLRSVNAAIQLQRAANKKGDNISRLVVASPSPHVVDGVTDWVHHWKSNQWLGSNNEEIRNRDLWELLVQELQVDKRSKDYLDVLFWSIPCKWNRVAHHFAKVAACSSNPIEHFAHITKVSPEVDGENR